jgi:hypothetical protein
METEDFWPQARQGYGSFRGKFILKVTYSAVLCLLLLLLNPQKLPFGRLMAQIVLRPAIISS